MQQEGLVRGFVQLFTTHKVAANLLMSLMILAGLMGLNKLNTQFFPEFELDVVIVQVIWPGASAEDVQDAITIPIEQQLKSVNYIRKVYADSRRGMSQIRLEVEEFADLDKVLDEVKQQVSYITTLPEEAEEPLIQQVIRYDDIATLLVVGQNSREELRPFVRNIEDQLLRWGIRKITLTGMPEQEISIQVSVERLHELGMNLEQLAGVIRSRSLDIPAGIAAKKDGSLQIRGLNQKRDVEGFLALPIKANQNGEYLLLRDIAQVVLQEQDDQHQIIYEDRPAIEVKLQRSLADDTLESAEIMKQWLQEIQPQLPEGIEVIAYNERWKFLEERIQLLLNNGLGGLILVIAILFLFLNVRVAWWVAVGIPVSFLATLAVLYLIGGSINMISLFGLIMALGIIVDDAIVVGEDTLSHVQQGEPAEHAAIGGAQRMLAPVVSSSLTTIAAFLPLFMVGGVIGNILVDIPIVVTCVIAASLVESFLVLPGHLNHSFRKGRNQKESPWRQRFDARFNHFRDHSFRRMVRYAVHHRAATLATALGLLVIAVGLLAGGRVKFTFFPVVDSDTLTAQVQFTTGTPPEQIYDYLDSLTLALKETESHFDQKLVDHVVIHHHMAALDSGVNGQSLGDEFGSLTVALVPAEQRRISNSALMAEWRNRTAEPAGLEKLVITQPRNGPPGKAVELKVSGQDINLLKQLSLQIQDRLKSYAGVSNIDDDLPFGSQQLIFSLTPAGEALGLDISFVGRQLRGALEGILIQSFYQGDDNIDVRIRLPESQRNYLSSLEQMPIILTNGNSVPLSTVVNFEYRKGQDLLRRIDSELSVIVMADVDDDISNSNQIISQLEQELLPQLRQQYPVRISYEGRAASQQETMADMRTGLILGLSLIYIILAWVFASYRWPLAIMVAIPFGLTGAIFGHFVQGMDLTVLSLFGFFGLSGIVINDSIVLITFYQKLRAEGMRVLEAIEEAACQRLRAVLLTSLTTIAGLTPILFETSLQAKFLIPMATSLVFGLAFGTALILLVVPAVLVLIEFRSVQREQKSADGLTPEA